MGKIVRTKQRDVRRQKMQSFYENENKKKLENTIEKRRIVVHHLLSWLFPFPFFFFYQ